MTATMTTRRLLVCAGLLAAPMVAHAAALDWTGTGPVLFYDTAGNWDPAQTPTLADDVTFAINVAGSPIIVGATSKALNVNLINNSWEFTGAAGGVLDSNGLLKIDDPTGTSLPSGVNVLASNGLTWDNAGDVIVGDSGYGRLVLQDGSDLLANTVFVGHAAGGVGEIILTGAGTSLTGRLNSNTGIHNIGYGGGTGTINVLAGAQLRTTSTSGNDIWVGGHADDVTNGVTGSVGTLNVDGTGSFAETEDLNVGIFGGAGQLNITNGGQVINTDGGTNGSPDTSFGVNDGFEGAKSLGFGLIDGDGSLLRSRVITVGSSGVGELTVSNGGVARTLQQGTSVGDMYIGNNAGSTGSVAVTGTRTDGTTASLLDVDDTLYVGNAGQGKLFIGQTAGGTQTGSGALQVDANLIIAGTAGNNLDNRVVVSGADATANVGGTLDVGHSGTGFFSALNGATITVGGGVSAGLLSQANGTILIDGADTTFQADSIFIGNGTGLGSTGQITVSGGAVATFTASADSAIGAVTLGDDDEGVGTLTITGPGSLVQSTHANGQWWIGGSANETGGTGTANILAGGNGIAAGRTVLGHQPGAHGTFNIDGDGSVFDANGDYILVGFLGTGEMNVTDGGVVNATRLWVADGAGSADSSLSIDGPGSQVHVARRFHVGDSDRGLVSVTNGGRLTVGGVAASERFIIGNEGGADGSKLIVDGVGSRVDYTGTYDIAIGNAGGSTTDRANLEVTGGAVFAAVQRDQLNAVTSSARIIVGDVTGGNGHILVDGAGSRVEARVLYVGDGDSSSSGLVDITNGGVIDLLNELEVGSNQNGVGTVNVVGPGSQLTAGTFISLGDDLPGNGAANGTLNIANGGYVANAGQAYIGHYTGASGAATVGSTTSDLSIWDVGGELTLAGTESSSSQSGSGTLNVNAGGVVNIASNLRIRNLGVVNMVGGELVVGGDILYTDVGSSLNFVFGKVRLTDPAGYTFTTPKLQRLFASGGANPTLFTGQHLAVDGTAVFGGPLRILGGELSVGAMSAASFTNIDFDTGTINLTNQDLFVGPGGTMGDNLTITAGQTLNVSKLLMVGGTSTLTVIGELSAGTLSSKGSIVVVNTGVSPKLFNADIIYAEEINLIGDVEFTGDVQGPANYLGPGTAIFSGIFAPGGKTVVAEFASGVGLADTAELQIQIGGMTPGMQHDQLDIAGDAQLNGHLGLSQIDGFVPTLGQSFVILTSAGLNGSHFDSVGGVEYATGRALAVTYSATDVTVTAAISGDSDLDGDVDDFDLINAIVGYTGSQSIGLGGGTWTSGDTDGDGDTDDFDLINMIVGYTGSLSSPGSNVPEPGSLVLLSGLALLAARRRRG